MQQRVRFATASDGVRIAWAEVGGGPPIVKAANWLNHLEHDWESPVWRHLFRALAATHTLIRYDERGNGLSDWNVEDLSFDAFVRDLETVVDAAGIDRFALLGISQGCAVSIAYAIRHPERVTHLVLHGGYPMGWAHRSSEEAERKKALLMLTRAGWGQNNPAFRRIFTSLYLPDGTPEQLQWFDDLQRISTSPENAARLQETLSQIDVRALLGKVTTPTLVLHSKDDTVVPVVAGRALGARIPGARYVELDSRNHLLLEQDPAWPRFLAEVRAFLGVDLPPAESSVFLPTGGALRGALAEAALRRFVRSPDGTVSDEPRSLPPDFGEGRLIGKRYRLERLLGRGGMGAVFRSRDTILERDVAVKVVAGAAADPHWRERVLREGRAAAALNHPSVVAVHDVGEENGTPYLVLELVPGPTLSERPPATEEEAVEAALRVCEALDHAHRRGIVHRDLKPANLLHVPSEDGIAIKLADLGIALVADDPRLTHEGRILGTPSYMAPEQATGGAVDGRADLYSLGAMLYEWLAGRPPFAGDGAMAVVSQHVHAPVQPPSHHRPGIDPRLEAVVMRLLEKDPEKRIRSAADARRALEAASAPSVVAPESGSPVSSIEIHEYLLRGRHEFQRGGRTGLLEARRWFTRALEADPGEAGAWSGLADCRAWEFLYFGGRDDDRKEAVRAGARAVELAPGSARARTSRAVALALEMRDVESGEEFERAVALDPGLFEARYLYGRFCYARGLYARAVVQLSEAEALDPANLPTQSLLAKALAALGRAEDAREAHRRALRTAERLLDLDPDDARALANGAHALVALGRRASGLEWANRARGKHPRSPMLYDAVCAFVGAGEFDAALETLEEVIAGGWSDRRWLAADRDLDPIRRDPRFERIGA